MRKKCLMFGLACSEEKFEKFIKKNKTPYSVAHYLFETELIRELENYYDIEHSYILQEKNHSIRKSLVKKDSDNITNVTKSSNIKYINLPLINLISLFFETIGRIFAYNKNNKDYYILSTINYLPVAFATILMSKILNKKNVIIFTDCTESNAYSYANGNLIKVLLISLYKLIMNRIEQCYDIYVNFSEEMNNIVNKKRKPNITMEGFFNSKDINMTTREKFDEFTVVYAGSLIEGFGLEKLIDVVSELPKDIVLKIYGDGPVKDKLLNMSKGKENICIEGFIERDKLFEILKRSHVVINTRNKNDKFTKYSFPSKTFEYLASGAIFISTKLSCYNDEYDDVIYFIEDDSNKLIKKAITSIYEMSDKDRDELSIKGIRFVKNVKNSKQQTLKVVLFLEEIFEKSMI